MADSVPAHDGRAPGRGFARLAVVTAVTCLALVALGGVVRATDSGLACPTWPGCFFAGDFVPGPDLKVWLEHSHRLLAGVVGLLIASQLLWAIIRHRHRPALVWPVAVAAVAVLVQAGLGALVVLQLLRAELVTAHLGMGMAVVGLLLFVALEATGRRGLAGDGGDAGLARAAVWVTGLALVQILVGGHVSGVGSGLAFVDGPLLGIASFGPIGGEGELFNVAHRVLAGLLVVAVGALALRTRRAGLAGWPGRLPAVAAGLVVVQCVIGVANLVSGLSFLTVIPHLAVASWIWSVLVLFTVSVSGRTRRAAGPVPVERSPEVAIRSGR